MTFGIFCDINGDGNYTLNDSFPTFLEESVAKVYLEKYIDKTGINSFIVLEIKKA